MSINLMSAIFRTEFRDLQDADGNNTKASTAKFVCIALADHANDEGEGAYPSIDTLAYKTNLSRTAVINALDALKHNGVLIANGESKRHTIDYTVNKNCFSQDSQRGVLVNPLDGGSQPGLPPGVNPVDPNHPLTINKTLPLSIENAIAMDMPVTDDMVQRENLRDLAPKMFERALGFTKPLPWWQGKEWTEFGEWVCERYAESASIFGEYNIWRNTPYTKGGMSNVRIRGFIKEFYDSWDMFMMSRKKTDETKPQYITRTIPTLERDL